MIYLETCQRWINPLLRSLLAAKYVAHIIHVWWAFEHCEMYIERSSTISSTIILNVDNWILFYVIHNSLINRLYTIIVPTKHTHKYIKNSCIHRDLLHVTAGHMAILTEAKHEGWMCNNFCFLITHIDTLYIFKFWSTNYLMLFHFLCIYPYFKKWVDFPLSKWSYM